MKISLVAMRLLVLVHLHKAIFVINSNSFPVEGGFESWVRNTRNTRKSQLVVRMRLVQGKSIVIIFRSNILVYGPRVVLICVRCEAKDTNDHVRTTNQNKREAKFPLLSCPLSPPPPFPPKKTLLLYICQFNWTRNSNKVIKILYSTHQIKYIWTLITNIKRNYCLYVTCLQNQPFI